MNKHINRIIYLLVYASCFSASVNATDNNSEARGIAMGNTGVASAYYLTAPFYNPALATNSDVSDDFGVIYSMGVNFLDADETYSAITDLTDYMDTDFGSTTSSSSEVIADLETLKAYLDDIDGNEVNVNVGLSIAIAIPTTPFSTTFFSRAYSEEIMDISTDSSTIDALINATNPDQSEINAASNAFSDMSLNLLNFTYGEIGFALSQDFLINEQHVSLGITPKYQYFGTSAQEIHIEDFSLSDFLQSPTNTDSAFNLDLGAVWYQKSTQIGLAVKNVITQSITAEYDSSATSSNVIYDLKPLVTIGFAYTSEYFIAAIDADLTEQTRFRGIDDNTQMVNFGTEFNAWRWVQLRAGYQVDLQGTLENTLTAGFGLSPFELAHLDVAIYYANASQMGAATNFALTF